MNYEKAHKELLAGKKIRRKEWDKFMHLQLINGEVKTFNGEVTYFSTDTNILTSTGWKVVDGDGTEMTFLESLEFLRQKKCITKNSLGEGYLFIDDGNWALCRPVEFQFMPTFGCLSSNDWEIIK